VIVHVVQFEPELNSGNVLKQCILH